MRLFEGEGSELALSRAVAASGDEQARLKVLLAACPDVPLIMGTLRSEIKRAVLVSR